MNAIDLLKQQHGIVKKSLEKVHENGATNAELKRIADELVALGVARRAVLGVSSQDAQGGGAQLTTVAEGSGAAAAGLKEGDVVTSLGGTRIANSEGLLATVRAQAPNSKVDLTYTRDGKSTTVTVALGSATDQT